MRAQIGITIEHEGAVCSIDCPFFSLEMGASFEKPIIEWCRLFKRALEVKGNSVYRTDECIAKDVAYLRKIDIERLKAKHKNKPAAVAILEKINFRFSLFDFKTVPELLSALLETKRVTREDIAKSVDISIGDLALAEEGTIPPYVEQQFRMMWGFPPPGELNEYERMLAVASLLGRHHD